MPYPGFPTDMQPQITAVLALASGTSLVTEGVWDNRFRYVGELGAWARRSASRADRHRRGRANAAGAPVRPATCARALLWSSPRCAKA